MCCGTGFFVLPLWRKVGPTGSILGVDFCRPMLERAAEHFPTQANFALGDALTLPLAPASMDGLTVGWGIRNLSDVDAAHREIYRVLKPGKRFVSVDMSQPRNRMVRAVSSFLFVNIVPRLASLFGLASEYMYLPKSTERFKSREDLVGSMTKAGFTQVGWQDAMLGNICIHWGLKP
jgi:demethylmenaquinone methyltransferase/2-methoxy-6-polyprenyl-1,4-benzoquinol methylase